MIRALFVALLISVSCTASAAWVFLGGTNEGIDFIDLSTVRKDGDIRTFWTMSNFNQRSPQGDMSSRHKQSINCKNETIVFLQYTTFTKPSLGGVMSLDLSLDPKSKWAHIPPQTVIAESMRLVCSN